MRSDRVFAWIAALLFGALVPAALFAGLGHSARLLPVTLVVALGHALLLGLPAAFLFRYEQWTSLLGAMATGFLIGALPMGILQWPLEPGSGFSTSTTGGVPAIADGIPTWAGWRDYLEMIGSLGLLGLAGALAFWLTLKACGALVLDGVPPYSRLAVWLAILAVLACAAAWFAPDLARRGAL